MVCWIWIWFVFVFSLFAERMAAVPAHNPPQREKDKSNPFNSSLFLFNQRSWWRKRKGGLHSICFLFCSLFFAEQCGQQPPLTHQKERNKKQISFHSLAAMPVNSLFFFIQLIRKSWNEKKKRNWMGCRCYIGPCSSRLTQRNVNWFH